MHDEYRWPRKVRFYATASLLYALSLGFGWAVVHPVHSLAGAQTVAYATRSQLPYSPTSKKFTVISGKPVRILIPDSGIDLPVDEGYYDPATDSWTLSGLRAQFDMLSTLANNRTGESLIYGHNNNDVFGALRHNTPAIGAPAQLHTDNGHIFEYKFDHVRSVGPDDVSALDYKGLPVLTVLTCTGSLNEWRTLYTFKFETVVK